METPSDLEVMLRMLYQQANKSPSRPNSIASLYTVSSSTVTVTAAITQTNVGSNIHYVLPDDIACGLSAAQWGAAPGTGAFWDK